MTAVPFSGVSAATPLDMGEVLAKQLAEASDAERGVDTNKLLHAVRETYDKLQAEALQLQKEKWSMSAELAQAHRHHESTASTQKFKDKRFNGALSSIKLGLVMFEADGDAIARLAVVNEKIERMLSILPSDDLSRLTLPGFCDFLIARLGELAGGAAPFEAYTALAHSRDKSQFNLVFKSGQVLQVSHTPTEGGGFVHTFDDVTDRRKAEARANHLASHDVLTNLPNRRLLKQHIYVALNDSHADCALLCVDLDRFKSVNDTLGHAGGDALLVEVTKRLRQCVRAGDTVGRLGGNEFVILMASVHSRDDAIDIAQRVIHDLSKPFDVLGQSVIVGASVGLAFAPQDGDSPDRLIKSADMALFEAKREGRGNFRFFEIALEERARDRQALELDLRQAVALKQFELHYQPVFAARQRRLIGFEALVRWNHPTRGRVSPLDFIQIAEELGLIIELGDWIIDEACRTAATWPEDIVVAVNVSARQFVNHDLFTVVSEALQRHGLPADRLEIEITESALMENSGEIAAVLQRIRRLGIGLAMDDFGTGYSSLAYLRRFHFSKVKIDRSFITGLATDTQSIAIVRAILALCKSLAIVVTAEGVETEMQAEILRLEDCDYLQGFLLGKPMPLAELTSLLAATPAASPVHEGRSSIALEQ